MVCFSNISAYFARNAESLITQESLRKSGGVDGGVPMSHVDYKKKQCPPVEFKKQPCRPVEFKKQSCRPVEFKKQSCRMSLRPKKGRVALSILRVNTPKSCSLAGGFVPTRSHRGGRARRYLVAIEF